MIVESGWGSMIPTVVIAHMDNKGPAAKSGQLNVGNQILPCSQWSKFSRITVTGMSGYYQGERSIVLLLLCMKVKYKF